MMAMGLTAAPVSRQQARQQAEAFMNERGLPLAQQAPHRAARSAAADDAYYYVFNAENNRGFVVMSGDDRTVPVLGYTDEGTFDEENLPDGLRWMLQTYSEQMELLDEVFAQYAASPQTASAQQPRMYSRPARHNVEPLLTMTWNQGDPYNLLCPNYYNQDGTKGDKCATGCVATAMAQVIGYYRWPEKTKRTIPGYIQKFSTDQGEKSERLNSIPAGSVIDWDNILDHYNGSETENQKKAIAQLMLWVGMDCKMSYGPSSASGYSEGIDGLVNYFDYDDGTHVASRGLYSLQAWDDLIYNEIATGHPVPYGGQNSGGGHAFVLDGYDISGLYHVNWGWGGMSNGYFRIDILDPDNNSGIGASLTPGGYNMGQDAIIGMKRPDGITADESETPQSRYKLTANDWELRSGNKFFANFVNWSGVAATWNMGLGYVNDEGKLTLIGSYNTSQINQNYYVGQEFVVRGLSEGAYHVVPISKRSTDTSWRTDVCPDVHYVLVEVDADGNVTKMEIRPVDAITMTSLEFPGNHKKGENQAVSATFQNNGEDEYFNEIHLLASQSQDKGTAICRTAIAMLPGGETTISLVFKPEQTGTWNVWLATDRDGNNIVGQGSFEVTEQGVTSNENLRYISHTLTNRSNGVVYGNRMQGAVTIRNQASQTFRGGVKLWLFKLADNGYYYGDQSTTVMLEIEPGRTGKASYYFENLQLNANYVMSILYSGGGDIQDGGLKAMGTTRAGVVYWQQNQMMSGMAPSSLLNTPAGAIAIDMSGLSNIVQTVRPNANRNTLYIMGENDVVPAGLEGYNVVKGGQAEILTLNDSANFLSPISFKAKEVSFTRNFKKGVWETVALPFAVQQLPEGCSVMTFSEEDEGRVCFTAADGMERNVPYLIKVNSNEPLTLNATDARVSSTIAAPMALGTDDFWFRGHTVFTSVQNAYVLNSEGTAFEYFSAQSIAPFRAYFTSTMSVESIPVEEGNTEGIVSAKTLQKTDQYYDLQGRRVTEPRRGIYIQNGKKIIK